MGAEKDMRDLVNVCLSRLRLLGAVTLFCMAACAAHAQIFNCYEGQGVLENAWNDWSWCTDNFQSSQYVYEGKYSIEVTYTAGYQGFSLESSNPFPAGYFSALTLYINGGPIAGRAIEVGLTVNGSSTNSVNASLYASGGGIRANAWTKVSIPLAAFGLKPTDQISRFWLQESSGQAQPPFWIGYIGWTPNAAPSMVDVAVSAKTILRTVPATLFGVNTAVWDSGLASSTCVNLVAKAGYKSFRFPGGSLSDGYNWVTNTTDSNTWTWPTDFDAWATMAIPQSRGQCFITTNYGTGTAAEAAAWVKYSNITKKYGIKYWEVGNECYGGWEEDSHALQHDPVTYAQSYAAYYKAMKAVDPTIKVGAVSTPGEDAYANNPNEVVTNPVTGVKHSGWTPVLLATLAKLGVTPDFLIYHRYPEYVNDCDFTLLVGNGGWQSDMTDLRRQLFDYLGKANTNCQLMCTENNCDAGNEGKQMCSLVNGVFFADTFGTVLQTECNSFLWWDLINGQSTTGDNGSWLYGWLEYGDEGVFSPDFSLTYPVYYMEQLVNDFAAPGDAVVPVTSSYGLLTAYATKRADGTMRVMFVNKTPNDTFETTLTLTGFTPKSTATKYVYGMAQDNAARIGQSQNISQSILSGVSATTKLTIAPYSVTVISFSPATAP
jgi:hypothetical protein